MCKLKMAYKLAPIVRKILNFLRKHGFEIQEPSVRDRWNVN